MKLALIIIFVVSLVATALFYFTTDRPSTVQLNMPWQVKVHDPMHSEVFSIVLNETTLDQVRDMYGDWDGLALFLNDSGEYSLEAYFSKVNAGPFGARVIVTMEAPQQELEKLTDHVTKRIKTRNDSIKWTLTAAKQLQQGDRRIRSLTYIPDYSGMDEGYLLQRLGEPEKRQKIDANSELWLYPEQGIRILVDSEGKEMFEYSAPAQFSSSASLEAQQ
jgi:hypothetical protein